MSVFQFDKRDRAGILSHKQIQFSTAITALLQWHLWNYSDSESLVIGEAYRPDRKGHKDNSLHYSGLAIDFKLYVLNPEDGEWYWQRGTSAYKHIGDYWKSIHKNCTWGGDFKNADGNHFSYGEK